MIWESWWIWGAAAVVLATLEMLAPGYIFLGFAAGAAVVSFLLLLGLDGMSLSLTALIFAVASLVAWVAFRKVFQPKGGSVRRIDHDINEN